MCGCMCVQWQEQKAAMEAKKLPGVRLYVCVCVFLLVYVCMCACVDSSMSRRLLWGGFG